MSSLPRVVVTGMGALTPYGIGAPALWSGISTNRSAIRVIQGFDTTGMPVNFAGEVDDLDPSAQVGRELPDTRDKALQMAFVSAAAALAEAGLDDPQLRPAGTAVQTIVGTGLGPCFEHEFSYGRFFQKGWRGVRPTTVPKGMFNSYASQLSIEFGLTGMNYSVACACASGAAAIGQGYHAIQNGSAQVVLAGGVDSPLCHSMFSAWTNLRVLAKHEDPQRASRPFDRDRQGLVLAEGAGMLVLEAAEHAQQRGARPLAEIRGFGSSSDASHLTAPLLDGPVRAMQSALVDAGLTPDDIDYINAHGTGTKANDETEARAIYQVFGSRNNLPISSIKSMIGHSMGASSAIEAIASVLAMKHKMVPPTLNCEHPDPDDLGHDYVPGVARSHVSRHVLSNSFGFGGANCVLILSEVDQ